jgi:hypothetical protein
MIQLLETVIEWLAMLALTSVGIDVEPVSCATAAPAEYRTVTAVYLERGHDAYRLSGSDDGCAEAAVRALRIDDTPRLITKLPQSYDS